MTLGTIARDLSGGLGSTPPYGFELVHFTGDTSYPTGGTAAFQAKIRALLKNNCEVMVVIPQDCGGYVPCYVKSADKLKVYYADSNNASDGPAIEVPDTTALNGITFNVLVFFR